MPNGLAVKCAAAGGVAFSCALGLLELFEEAVVPAGEGMAALVAVALRAYAMPVRQAGAVLGAGNGFEYEIGAHCHGIEICAAVTALILVQSRGEVAGYRVRVLALSLGLVLALNLLRLISLFVIGAIRPALFGAAHELAWPLIFGAVVWWLWARVRTRVSREVT